MFIRNKKFNCEGKVTALVFECAEGILTIQADGELVSTSGHILIDEFQDAINLFYQEVGKQPLFIKKEKPDENDIVIPT